jgi:glycosyltransferase involved in cell wall biosynthesis
MVAMNGAVGMYRVKNEARWIGESLSRALMVADEVILLDDHSTDATVKIAKAFDRVTVIESPFSGLDESRDKNLLWQAIVAKKPRWVFLLDGDETFTLGAVQELTDLFSNPMSHGVYRIRIIYLWDKTSRERNDPPYNHFYTPRVWSVHDLPNAGALIYRQSGFGGNFHCGPMPKGHPGKVQNLVNGAIHYGYLYPDDRQRKYEFYSTTDPNNTLEGGYVHIIGLPNRVAPGPVQFRDIQIS